MLIWQSKVPKEEYELSTNFRAGSSEETIHVSYCCSCSRKPKKQVWDGHANRRTQKRNISQAPGRLGGTKEQAFWRLPYIERKKLKNAGKKWE